MDRQFIVPHVVNFPAARKSKRLLFIFVIVPLEGENTFKSGFEIEF